jgi:hypothetical protein
MVEKNGHQDFLGKLVVVLAVVFVASFTPNLRGLERKIASVQALGHYSRQYVPDNLSSLPLFWLNVEKTCLRASNSVGNSVVFRQA